MINLILKFEIKSFNIDFRYQQNCPNASETGNAESSNGLQTVSNYTLFPYNSLHTSI